MDERFLAVAEIADLLKLNPQTVRNYIDRGELKAVRVGKRRVRVREADLEEFLRADSPDRAPHPADGLPAIDAELVPPLEEIRRAVAQGDITDAADSLDKLAALTAGSYISATNCITAGWHDNGQGTKLISAEHCGRVHAVPPDG